MAKGARYKKYSRRASSLSRAGSRTALIILAVVAFLALCLIVSVAIGIALGKRTEKLPQREGLDLTFREYYSGDRQIKAVNAYLYDMEYDVSNIWRDLPDFSFCLRRSDGGMGFDPELGFLPAGSGGDKLSEHVEYIKEYGGYVCGYMYVSAFSSDDVYLADVQRAFEISRVNKASECGVDEILLIFPEINENNIDKIEKFISDASSASKNAAVGVLISPDLLKKTEDDVYYASRLRAVCDFAAIDLREATVDNIEEMLRNNEYYITSYPLRGVFDPEMPEVAAAARKLGMNNTQFIGK
jgi:hypothetical protein